MIQKLCTRFILLSMSTLLAVLAVLVGGINLASYRSIVSEADRILAAENPVRADKKILTLEKQRMVCSASFRRTPTATPASFL